MAAILEDADVGRFDSVGVLRNAAASRGHASGQWLHLRERLTKLASGVAEALSAPYLQILANAGLAAREHLGTEVDVIRGVPADLTASGSFDSSAVLRSALTTAVDATVRFLRVA